MGLGDIKSAPFRVEYRAKGTGTIAAGDIVAYDTDGDVIPATASTLGKHGILTALTHVVSGTTYFGVLVSGLGVCLAGGAIKPNDFVESAADQDAVVASTTISTTVLQAEVQRRLRILGKYIRLESDNQYAASDAADTNLIIVNVGEGQSG